MTIEEKEKILRNIFNKTDIIDEKDKPSIIAYNKAKGECTKKVWYQLKIIHPKKLNRYKSVKWFGEPFNGLVISINFRTKIID